MTNGYPNRAKIKDFVDRYEGINTLTATNSNAKLSVNGIDVEVSGYSVNDSNYYKIRDIARYFVQQTHVLTLRGTKI